MAAQPKADAPQLWDLAFEWKQIVLGMRDGGSENPDQPIGTDLGKLSETLKWLGNDALDLRAARDDAVIRFRRWLG